MNIEKGHIIRPNNKNVSKISISIILFSFIYCTNLNKSQGVVVYKCAVRDSKASVKECIAALYHKQYQRTHFTCKPEFALRCFTRVRARKFADAVAIARLDRINGLVTISLWTWLSQTASARRAQSQLHNPRAIATSACICTRFFCVPTTLRPAYCAGQRVITPRRQRRARAPSTRRVLLSMPGN